MNRWHAWKIVGSLILGCGLMHAQSITTFEAPGAGTAAGQGTLAEGITAFGQAFGYYMDGSGVAHGFLRSAQGGFTTLDAPDAGAAVGQGTFAFSVNPAGIVVGYSIDASGVMHGFERTAAGTFTIIDAPGAGTAPGQGTFGYNIAPGGTRFAEAGNFVPFDREMGYSVVDALKEVANRHDATPARVALAWVLGRAAVSSVIIAARKPEQLEDNIRAVDLQLSGDDVRRLDAVSDPGVPYPKWMVLQLDTAEDPRSKVLYPERYEDGDTWTDLRQTSWSA